MKTREKQDRMPLIGLTGGICTGKSEACKLISAHGWPVISTDLIGHELLDEDPGCREAVRSRFGEGVFEATGRVKRESLAAIVFSDPQALCDLGAILHPLIRLAYLSRAAQCLEDQKPQAIVIEIPLLFEVGAEADFCVTVATGCTEEVQLARLTGQRELSREEALRRLRSQLPTQEKMNRADLVLWNQFSRKVLEVQMQEIIRKSAEKLSSMI